MIAKRRSARRNDRNFNRFFIYNIIWFLYFSVSGVNNFLIVTRTSVILQHSYTDYTVFIITLFKKKKRNYK